MTKEQFREKLKILIYKHSVFLNSDREDLESLRDEQLERLEYMSCSDEDLDTRMYMDEELESAEENVKNEENALEFLFGSILDMDSFNYDLISEDESLEDNPIEVLRKYRKMTV